MRPTGYRTLEYKKKSCSRCQREIERTCEFANEGKFFCYPCKKYKNLVRTVIYYHINRGNIDESWKEEFKKVDEDKDYSIDDLRARIDEFRSYTQEYKTSPPVKKNV